MAGKLQSQKPVCVLVQVEIVEFVLMLVSRERSSFVGCSVFDFYDGLRCPYYQSFYKTNMKIKNDNRVGSRLKTA